MHLLLKILATVAILYVIATLALYFGQRRLMYVPDRTRVLPSTVGLTSVEEHIVTAPDGAKIVTWRTPLQPGQKTILYFHGNGGMLANRAGRINALQQSGLGVVMMSYRGYSGSTGAPTEASNTADARLIYDLLLKDGLTPNDIVVYGESLGTGVTTRLTSEVEVAGVILDSPFTSVVDRAAELYPYFWVRPFIADEYPVATLIDRINAPLLVLHGANDQVIPVRMGEAVFAAAREPKTLKIFPEGNHSDLFDHGALKDILTFVGKL